MPKAQQAADSGRRSSSRNLGPRNGSDADLLGFYQGQISQLQTLTQVLQEALQSQKAHLAMVNESRIHLSHLFENSPICHLVHDGGGYIKEINPAGERFLGLKGKLSGQVRCVVQFLAEESLQVWLRHLRQCKETGKQAITELTLKGDNREGRRVQVITVPIFSEDGGHSQSYYAAIIDISEHAATELVLNQTHGDHLRLIDMMDGIMWEADAQSLRFTYVSQYAERLFGYPLEEWTRPGFWESRIYVEDRERVMNEVHHAVARRDDLQLDYRMVRADRRQVWLSDSITVVERNKKLTLLGVAIDITEKRNAAEQIIHAHNSLESKVNERTLELRRSVSELEAFSYSLSHDMRAPIRAMRGYAELLETQIGQKVGAKASEYLKRIISSADRLDLLVQDVLQFNRVARAPLQMKAVALEPLINNILHDYPALASNKAEINIEQPLMPIRGHEAFVCQALSNLLTNAVKFVPPGRAPKVRLWTEFAEAKAGEVDRSDYWVRIWVEDNGLGIAPEDQPRIFRMFERVHSAQEYEGTGIGLAIVQKAVERMGGHLGVESTPGKGSRFWIDLLPA